MMRTAVSTDSNSRPRVPCVVFGYHRLCDDVHRRQTPSPLVHLPPEPSPLRCSFVDNHLARKGTSNRRFHGDYQGEDNSFSVPPQTAASFALQLRCLRSPLLGYAPPTAATAALAAQCDTSRQ